MSTLDKIDALVLGALSHPRTNAQLCNHIRRDVLALAKDRRRETGIKRPGGWGDRDEVMRAVDASLQRLRKSGRITRDGRKWYAVEAQQ